MNELKDKKAILLGEYANVRVYEKDKSFTDYMVIHDDLEILIIDSNHETRTEPDGSSYIRKKEK
jgi:hypothetical protein